MALLGNYPIAQMPLLPQRAAPTTQVQKSGTNGIADRTITTPPDFTNLTFSPGGVVCQVNPSMVTPGNLCEQLNDAGVSATITASGLLSLPNTTAVSGNANLTHALGLS